jgi:hypothetical protein
VAHEQAQIRGEGNVARTEKKTNKQESGVIDHDSYIDMTHREKVLFTMSLVRTICALLGALAQAIVLYKVYHIGH